jgi:hypothetical protein
MNLFAKIIFFLGLMITGNMLFAQKVFSVQYESQADVKVFVVDYESQAGKNDGKWFFTQYESQSQKTIYFAKYASQADVKIFFVDYESQAGWKNNSKKQLFY